jgi:hypothetical protein
MGTDVNADSEDAVALVAAFSSPEFAALSETDRPIG